MNFRKPFFLGVLAALSWPTAAQDTLSLADCRALALQSSANIRIAEKQQQRALAEKQAAFANYLPRISATGGVAYLFNDIDMGIDIPKIDLGPFGNITIPIGGISVPISTIIAGLHIPDKIPFDISLKGAYMAGIRLEQPLFAGGKIVTGNKMASIGRDMAGENARMQRASAIAEADKAYWVYVSVREKIKILDSYDRLLGMLDSTMQTGVSIALLSEKELLKVRSKRSSLAYERQRARHGLELARMALCQAIGKDFATPIVPADTTLPNASTIGAQPADSVGTDISARPELRLLQHKVALSAQQVRFTRADFLPVIGLGAGYNHIGNIKFADAKKSFNMPFMMLSANIPLFHFGEGARKIRSARLQHEMDALEVEKSSQLLGLQAQKAAKDWLDAQAQIAAAADALSLADEDLRVSRAAFEAQMGTLIDYLDAQAQWQQAFSDLIEARASCKIKETEYLLSVGKLDE